jgi:hypothetical protein
MTADTPNAEGETWFGSGLRAHLGIQHAEEPGEPTEVVEPNEPKLQVPVMEERVVQHADVDAAEALLAELAERERRLAEAETRIRETRAELELRADEILQSERRLPVRNSLRERAERETDRLWRTIDEALEATFDDGRPDFHARLAAIKLLLGEAYDDASAVDALPPREDPQPEDELAVRRAERFQI